MPVGNMRANGVRSLAVSCRQCHHRAVLSADPWRRSRADADVRVAHDLHPMRHHRCRRPAELARATGAAERPWCRAMAMSAERHRALRLLAGSPLGATEAIMLAHGFTYTMLDTLVRDGLATAEQREMRAGRRPITVIWLTMGSRAHLAGPKCRIGPGRLQEPAGCGFPARGVWWVLLAGAFRLAKWG
jgi:hypothetical protein